MNRMIRSTWLLLMGSMVLFSGEDTDTLRVYNMEDSIVVVANRYKTSIKNLAYSYEVIPRDQIRELAVHSALEVIDIHFPSAFLFEKKVMGFGVGTDGSGQIYLRGQGGQPNTGVLVLLNGHPDFMGIFGHPLPDVYGMDDISQAEILAGPASTVFGSNAMGGVINLVTTPDYSKPMKISLEAGSYDTYNIGLNLNRQVGDHGLFLTLRRKYSGGHMDRTSFSSYHFQGGWEYQINPQWNLSLSGRYVPYEFDDPARGDLERLGTGIYGMIKRGTGEIKLGNKTDAWQGSFQMYTNLGSHRFYDGFKSTDFTYGLSVYQHWTAQSRYSLAAGLDLLQYGGEAENRYAYLPSGQPSVNEDSHTLNSAGAYILGFYNPIHFLNLKLGARYHHNSLPLNSVTPVLGVTFSPAASFRLFTSYQTGFHDPTLRDLYLFPSGNPELEEERITSIDIGGVYTWSGNNSIKISAYRNDARNMIQTVSNPSPPPPVIFQNSGMAKQYGIESMVKYHPRKNIALQFSHSYLEPDGLTAFNPQHQFKYLILSHWKGTSLTLFGKSVSNLYAANNGEMKLPDYTLLNISASRTYKNLGVSLKLNNLLNRRYRMLPGYEAPGFHLLGGLNYNL